MQFQKKTSIGRFGNLIKLSIKVAFFLIIILLLVILVDKINFPHPNKKIEKIISNENFKVVK
tara:strand:+ start:2367 stop:2552 length:186 start_codon:yes stop_codon:yes gene_type:complete